MPEQTKEKRNLPVKFKTKKNPIRKLFNTFLILLNK